MELTLTLIGRDSHSRPVYESNGRLYVDTDPRTGVPPKIRTKLNNEFDSEPCDPVHPEVRFQFVPKRDVW